MNSTDYESASNSQNCAEFIISLLCFPAALATFVVIAYRSYKRKQLVDALPLLFCQLNTAFVWSCMGAFSIILFSNHINGDPLIKGNFFGFRDKDIQVFLVTANQLLPLNLFFYTWSLLEILEREEKNQIIKRVYRQFARLSIWLIPMGFYAVYFSLVIEGGYLTQQNFKKKRD